MKRSLKLGVLCLVAATVLLIAPAQAHDVTAGIDLWKTVGANNATYVDFSMQTIPLNFFCNGYGGYMGTIALKGKAIAATKSLQGADTIIERTTDENVNGDADMIVRALSLQGKTQFSAGVCGTTHTVKVRLDPNRRQDTTNINFVHSASTGGVFTADISVKGEVVFTEVGSGVVRMIRNDIVMQTSNACWNHTTGTGGITVSGPVTIDTTCDGIPDLTLPGTSNFHAGWCPPPSGSGPPTSSTVNHTGPHPTKPPVKKCTSIKPIDIEFGVHGGEQVDERAIAVEIGIAPCRG